MRKLVLRMLTSIDGLIADPGGDLRFGLHWSEDMQRFYVETFDAAGGLVYGRVVYEKYVPYWEAVAETGKHYGGEAATDAEVEYATRVRDLPKYVASNTLDGVTGNTTVVRGVDLVKQVAALKSQPGGDLLLMCGPALLSALSAEALVRPVHARRLPRGARTGSAPLSRPPRADRAESRQLAPVPARRQRSFLQAGVTRSADLRTSVSRRATTRARSTVESRHPRSRKAARSRR
jgi:dihydrofolate reductase